MLLDRFLEVIVGQEAAEVKTIIDLTLFSRINASIKKFRQVLYLSKDVQVKLALKLVLPLEKFSSLQEYLSVLILLESRHDPLIDSLSLKLCKSRAPVG